MKRWQFVLTTLVILFAPPFLVTVAIQGLFWLLYRLFDSVSLPAWFGIRGFAVTVVGMHILISTVLMGLLVRRRKRAERQQFVLTAMSVPLAMPFLAIGSLSLLWKSLYRLFPSTRAPFLWFGLAWYVVLSEWLMSNMTRYGIVSLAALTLSSTALIRLLIRERSQVWRRGHFYVLLIGLAAVLAFPFVMRYQPAVEAASGVEMHMVERPGLLEGAVKRCQVGAEVRGCLYEPLGWADAQTLVYRKWCSGHYTEEGWYPNSPGDPLAYHLATDTVAPFLGDPSVLSCDMRFTPKVVPI